MSDLNDQQLDCHRPAGAAAPLFHPFSPPFCHTTTAGRRGVGGGRGVSLSIINVTLIVINIVFDASLGHKEIFWLRLDHIHGKPCHRSVSRVTPCERVCPTLVGYIGLYRIQAASRSQFSSHRDDSLRPLPRLSIGTQLIWMFNPSHSASRALHPLNTVFW